MAQVITEKGPHLLARFIQRYTLISSMLFLTLKYQGFDFLILIVHGGSKHLPW